MYIYQIFVKIGLVLILIWQACFGVNIRVRQTTAQENGETTQKAIRFGKISEWVPFFGIVEYFWQLANS